jgi:hypothetical protein
MARDTRAIVVLVNACKGISHGAGHTRTPHLGPESDGRSRRYDDAEIR